VRTRAQETLDRELGGQLQKEDPSLRQLVELRAFLQLLSKGD